MIYLKVAPFKMALTVIFFIIFFCIVKSNFSRSLSRSQLILGVSNQLKFMPGCSYEYEPFLKYFSNTGQAWWRFYTFLVVSLFERETA